MARATNYEVIVMGTSAGGLDALSAIVPAFPAGFRVPIAVVQHLGEDSDGFLANHLGRLAHIEVKEACDKMPLEAGTLYLAPAGYHLLIERERSFALSMHNRVNHVRPSIDVLFTSAAAAYGARLIGVILTGANSDGSHGLYAIEKRGGLTVVQEPGSAMAAAMPQAAIDVCVVDHILALEEIGPFLASSCRE